MLRIQEAVLHILDKDRGNLFLSDFPLSLDDGYVQEYINRLYKKIMEAPIKTGLLSQDAEIWKKLQNTSLSLLDLSRELSSRIYEIISPAENISSADYLFFRSIEDDGQAIFGMIRLDYQSHYTHLLTAEEGMKTQLIQHHSILPQMGQTPKEACLIHQEVGTYSLIEKAVEIEGEKQFYFSQQVLGIEAVPTSQSQIKNLRKTINSVAKRYDEPTYETLAYAQQEVYQQLETEGVIDSEKVVERVFEENAGALMAAKQELDSLEMPQKIQVTNIPKYERKYSKQKFKLDNGIEIVIPIDLYGNEEVVEFITQPDGTISVIIKNIEAISNQFNG